MKNPFDVLAPLVMPGRTKLCDEYAAEFSLAVVSRNIKYEKLLSYILIAINLVLLLIDVLASWLWTGYAFVICKFERFNYFLLVVPVVFSLFARIGERVNEKNVKMYRTIHFAALSAVLMLCSAIAADNAGKGLLPYAYIVAMFCISSLIILDDFKIYAVYLITYVWYAVIISLKGIPFHDLEADLIFLLTLVMLSSMVSIIRFTGFKNSFMDKKLILEKNEELNSLSALLIKSNAILRAQLESSQDGIVILSNDLRVMSYNQKFIDMLGLPDDIMKYRDGRRIYYHFLAIVSDRKDIERRILEVYQLADRIYCGKVKLKNETILDIYSAPVMSYGEIYGKVWYINDITEKERMMDALRESSELKERLLQESREYDELKSEFFVNISHEFRTPLNILLGTLQLLNTMKADLYDTKTKQKVTKYFAVMKQNCYRLLRLTNNLIDMTRLDTGFLEMNLQYYNIVQVVEDITLSVAAFAENKGISLIFDTDCEEKIIAVDVDKIERIILNLLSNAVKFTRQGTIIVRMQDMGDSVRISVKDTGIGIPQEKLNIVFERFRQVDSSLTRDHEGSGIGLSLAKNLVELHGGSIEAVSEIGKGSEFIITLPCRSVSDEEMTKTSVYNTQDHVERISIEFSDIYPVV
jgi:signal transduction histidine kinase